MIIQHVKFIAYDKPHNSTCYDCTPEQAMQWVWTKICNTAVITQIMTYDGQQIGVITGKYIRPENGAKNEYVKPQKHDNTTL